MKSIMRMIASTIYQAKKTVNYLNQTIINYDKEEKKGKIAKPVFSLLIQFRENNYLSSKEYYCIINNSIDSVYQFHSFI